MTGFHFIFLHGALLVFWLGSTFATRHTYFSVLPASLFVWHVMGILAGFAPGAGSVGVIAVLGGPIAIPYAVIRTIDEWPVSGSIMILASGLIAWLAALRIGMAQSIGVRSLIWNLCFVLIGLIAYLVSYRVFGPFDVLQLKGTL